MKEINASEETRPESRREREKKNDHKNMKSDSATTANVYFLPV